MRRTTDRIPDISSHILLGLVERRINGQHIPCTPHDNPTTNMVFETTFFLRILEYQQTQRICCGIGHTVWYDERIQRITSNPRYCSVWCKKLITALLRITIISGDGKLPMSLIRVAIFQHIERRIDQPKGNGRTGWRRITVRITGNHRHKARIDAIP